MMNFSLLLNIQPQLVFLLSLTLVKSYRFTLPSKDTTWYLERPCEIRWQTEGSDLRLVELYLVQSQGQGHKQSLSSSLTGMEGIYNYPSLKGIQIGEGYKVQMVSVNTKSVLSESPMFSIRATPGSSGSNEMNSTFGRQIGGPMMGNSTGYRSGGGGSVSSSYAGLGGYRNSSSYGGGYQNGTFGGSGHSGTMNNTIGMGEGTSGGIKPNTIHGSSQVLGGGINQGKEIYPSNMGFNQTSKSFGQMGNQASIEESHAEHDSHSDAPASLQPQSASIFIILGFIFFMLY